MTATGTSHPDVTASRIVIADDSEPVREVLERMLLDHGHEVVGVAVDGAEALDLVDARRPTAVVLDHRMPGMTGLEAAEVLGRWHPHLPVLMFTGTADPAIVAAAHRAGVCGYYLREEVRDLLDHLAALRTRVRRD